MPNVKWIERVPPGLVNFLDSRLSLGLQRNKIMLPCSWLKWSMSPPEIVVHNFFGCDKLLRIFFAVKTLKDYGYTMNHILLLCDNENAIKIAYNSCEYSRIKHIDIQHHFLRDHVIKGDIAISHVETNDQLANIFTKPLTSLILGMWLRILHI
jgi:hypothetical protein